MDGGFHWQAIRCQARGIGNILHTFAAKADKQIAHTVAESQNLIHVLEQLKQILLDISFALSPDDDLLETAYLVKASYWHVMLWDHRESMQDFDRMMEGLAALYARIEEAFHLVSTNERQLEQMREELALLRKDLDSAADVEVENNLGHLIDMLNPEERSLELVGG